MTRISAALFALQQFLRKIWVMAATLALLALVAAFGAPEIGAFVPDAIAQNIDEEALTRILEIVAASMLAVTTFSLSIVVATRQSASTQATPRAYRLLIDDQTTKSVLAVFVGAFVFSLVTLIAVSTGLNSGGATAIILLVTLIVVSLVVVAILRWIHHLSDLGTMDQTAMRVEEAARRALRQRVAHPCLGAKPLTSDIAVPDDARIVTADRSGYVQRIDMRALAALTGSGGCVYVLAPPGHFAALGTPILKLTGDIDADQARVAVTIGNIRSFAQDPRFGIIVLAEIAQRALSPSLNDPGTGIDIIGRLLRLLLAHPIPLPAPEDIRYHRVLMPPVDVAEMVRDGFDPIARDGAGMVEVQLRLQKALADLSRVGDADLAAAAGAASRRALELSDADLPLDGDRDRVRAVAP